VLDAFVHWFAVQPAGPAIAALMIDRLWPRRRASPPAVVARPVAILVRRLNRARRPAATRRFRGTLLWLVVVGLAVGLGFAVAAALRDWLPAPWPAVSEVFILAAGIAYQAARSTARRAVQGLASLGPRRAEQVGTIACARLASRFADGAVALPLAYLAAGLPGLFAIKAGQWLVHAVDRDRDGDFGRAVRRCHGLLTAPAAWIAGVLIGLGRLPAPGLAPSPAVTALAGVLDRGGLVPSAAARRLAGARIVVDRAHALWIVVLAAASVLSAVF